MNRRQFLASSATAAVAATAMSGCKSSAAPQKLTVFTWADYLSAKAKASFEAAHHCTVVIDTFDSNEAMLAKLESGATGYDVLVPSSYAVQALQRKNLIQSLDHTKLPNLTHLDNEYLTKAADPAMKVSVPYLMAPTCLAYLAAKVPNPITSWAILERTDFRGRVTLLDDMREVLGAALKSLGLSLNSSVPAELESARTVVLRWKANLAKFENEQYKTGLASGEFYLVQGYAGDLLQAQEENADIRIFIPQEGTSFPCDDLCLTRDTRNLDLAHAFINHLCDPAVAAENMETLGYRAPNKAAYPLLTEKFRNSPLLFPPPALFNKCEPIRDLGDQLPLWTAAWDRIKGS